MSLVTDILSITGSYMVIIGVQFFVTNFLMKGAVTAYLKVRASRGKRLLVLADTITDSYWRPGEINDDAVTYKKRNGKEARIVGVPKSNIYSMWGVHMVHVDEEKNCTVSKSGQYTAVNTFEEVDQHVERALNAPKILDKKETIALVFAILNFTLLVVLCFFLFSMNKKLGLLTQLAGSVV